MLKDSTTKPSLRPKIKSINEKHGRIDSRMSTIELLSCLGLNGMDKPRKAVLAFAEVRQMSAYSGSVRGALRRPGFTKCTADELSHPARGEQINRTLSSGYTFEWRGGHPIPPVPAKLDGLPMHEMTDLMSGCFCIPRARITILRVRYTSYTLSYHNQSMLEKNSRIEVLLLVYMPDLQQ